MQRAFPEAVMGARHKVFGYNLRPLSAAHLFYLEAVKSPVFGCGKTSPDDLLLAAKVCAEPIRFVNGAYVPNPSLRVTLRDQWRLAKASVNVHRLTEECRRWNDYCEDYLACPEIMETPGKAPATVTAPAIMALVVAGLKLFGEARAWSMPFGLLRTYVSVYNECKGAEIRFAPGEDEIAEIEAQIAAAEQAGAELLRRRKESGV